MTQFGVQGTSTDVKRGVGWVASGSVEGTFGVVGGGRVEVGVFTGTKRLFRDPGGKSQKLSLKSRGRVIGTGVHGRSD